MSIQDVISNIEYASNIGPSIKQRIEAVLTQLYALQGGSTFLDQSLYKPLRFELTLGTSEADVGKNLVRFNPQDTIDQYYISNKGKVVKETDFSVIVHELSHAILSTRDFEEGKKGYDDLSTAGTDYVGEAVPVTNYFLKQIDQPLRISYSAAISKAHATDAGIFINQDLTAGRDIVAAVVNSWKFTEINMSAYDKGVVIIGNHRNEVIVGGQGDDYINGEGGENNISGGEGIDIIIGGDQRDFIYANSGSKASDGVADYLTGGGGNDTFFVGGEIGDVLPSDIRVRDWYTGEFNPEVRSRIDIIRDFSTGDKIYVALDDDEYGLGFGYTEFSYELSYREMLGDKVVYDTGFESPDGLPLIAIYDLRYDEYMKEDIGILIFYEPELYYPVFAIERAEPTGIDIPDQDAAFSSEDSILFARHVNKSDVYVSDTLQPEQHFSDLEADWSAASYSSVTDFALHSDAPYIDDFRLVA